MTQVMTAAQTSEAAVVIEAGPAFVMARTLYPGDHIRVRGTAAKVTSAVRAGGDMLIECHSEGGRTMRFTCPHSYEIELI